MADPSPPGRQVSYFAIRETDPDTAGPGNKRCEYAYAGSGLWIPWERDFWFGVAVRTSALAGSTDQQTVWQWHEGSATMGLSPYLAAIVSGNRLSIQLRHNANETFSQTNTTVVKVFDMPQWQADSWYRFVVKARLARQAPGSSQLKVWLNGAPVVDYRGPLGYLYPNPRDYVKVGLYHWTNAGNTWSPAVPRREAWVRGPVMLPDAPDTDERSIDRFLQ